MLTPYALIERFPVGGRKFHDLVCLVMASDTSIMDKTLL